MYVCKFAIFFFHAYRSEDEPVYEIPPEKYAAENIVRILLNPKIDKQRVCKQRPLDIQRSSTFVVDLDSLQHPDDVKKDNFGVWTHSGSHDQKFESRINAAGILEVGRSLSSSEGGWEQFSLRHLHSKHPTNSKFQRIISFITGDTLKYMYILALSGLNTASIYI